MKTIGTVQRANIVTNEWLMAIALSADAGNIAQVMFDDAEATNLILNNSVLLGAIGSSGTVYDAIKNSPSMVTIGKWVAFKAGLSVSDYADVSAIVASTTAMEAVAASSVSVDVLATNSTAMALIEANVTAVKIWMLSGTTQVYGDFADINAIAASATAMGEIAASATAMKAVVISPSIMTAIAASATAKTAIVASSVAIDAIVGSDIACTALRGYADFITSLDGSSPITVPTMTSNTLPSGVASTLNPYAGATSDYLVFDKSNATQNIQTGSALRWWQYQFASPVWCYKVTLVPSTDSINRFPKDFKVQYSSDGAVWADALSATTPGKVAGTTYTFTVCASSGRVKYWRLYEINNHGDTGYATLAELNFYCK